MGTGALIAAAGLSSRMGAFKPMLPLGGDTIIRRGVKTLLAGGCAPVAVVTGREAERLRAHLSDLPVTCLYNPDYASCQMLDSVKLGLRWLEGRCGRLLFTPGDVCLYGTETVEALLASRAPVCFPVYAGRRGHPILISASLIPSILSYGGEGGLAGALAGVPGTEELPADAPGVLLDADTPEDYRRMLSLLPPEERT